MTKYVKQEFNEIKVEFEKIEEDLSRLVEKRNLLQDQLTRLNLVQQIQNQGLMRRTPTWIVDESNKLVINSSSG
jgi:hypothetical protein